MTDRADTIAAALRRGCARLRAARVPEAALKAEWALARVVGCARLELRLRGAERLTRPAAARWENLLGRLAAHEPLQYVLGDAEFRGRLFACDRRALIPRPETEELVELALNTAELWEQPLPRVADAGTGSGVIAITLALERPHAKVIATEISEAALALARENARRHGVSRRIVWRRADWLAGLRSSSLDAVISNPPYVARKRMARLARQVRAYEPRMALDGGPDGMEAIRRLSADAAKKLRPCGWLFLEIGEEQGTAVRSLLRSLRFQDVRVHRDRFGRERFAAARL